VHQQQFEGFLATCRLVADQTVPLEQRFEREQVLWQVVDQKEVDRLAISISSARFMRRPDRLETP
jgi:hypothetical protein